ncbi:unnamed protein product [Calypogeia fissa]
MPMSLPSESSERGASAVSDPNSTSDILNGHNITRVLQKGLRESESGKDDENSLTSNDAGDNHMTEVSSGGAAVENGGNYMSTGRNVSSSSSDRVEQKQNPVDFGRKKEWNDRNKHKDEYLTVSTKERDSQLSIKHGSKHKSLQSMEETCRKSVFFESRSNEIDERLDNWSLDGSDGSYCQELTRSKSSREATKHLDNEDWLPSNSEHAAFFGGDDLREFLHEHDVGIDCCAELCVDVKQHDAGGQVDIPMGTDEDNGAEHAYLRDGPELDCLPRNSVHVRATGRPDLDDAEYDPGRAEEGLKAQPATTTFLDNFGNCGSGRPDLEEDDVFLDDRVTQDIDLKSTCNVGSVIQGLFPRTGRDYTFGTGVQIEEHDQEVRGATFNERLFRHADSKVTPEMDFHQDGIISDESQFVQGIPSTRIRLVQLLERLKFEPSLETKLQASGGNKDKGLRVLNAQNSIFEKNVKGSVHTMLYDLSHDVPEEDCDPVDTLSEVARDRSRRGGVIVRIGSKEAEELLQMDVAKIGKAIYTRLEPSSKRPPVPIYERAGVDWAAEDLGPDELSRYVEALEVKETYIDTVLDMEDILFDAEEGAGARGKTMSPGGDRPARDGTVSAPTSSKPSSISRQLGQSPSNLNEVDWVEVVGASQRRGGASFGDRVVGVKEHTLYRIKVYGRGYDWEIHRRYRDFVALHNQLLQLFIHKGAIHLPTSWGKVNAESRKLFGNTSPGVVEVRSALIQVCLQSLLQAGPPLSTAVPLLRFLFPDRVVSHSVETQPKGSGSSCRDGQVGSHVLLVDFTGSQKGSPLSKPLTGKAEQDQDDEVHTSTFGKTIRLIVQIQKKKSLKQQLQAQHFTCAGCYKHLELALGLLPELVQNWGWTGPRFCEYSGQIFCSTCHLNETAVIPAWVLQRWDLTPRHVSQLAKAYLDSIYDKPMLCVSAVNPYLYARVPVLALLTDIRRNLSKMLACIRCPARARIQAMMGSRCYLLESNDFFALRDLADLSKGAFAVLPGYMQAIFLKLSVHIRRECSACRELGEACGAAELCCDPFDVIYPYQDKGITRCQLCHSPYHTGCFLKGNDCCSWRRRQSRQTLKDLPHVSDVSYTHLNSESDPRMTVTSSLALGKEDLTVGSSSVTSGKNPVRAKRRLLTNLVGPEELQSPEFQRESRNSAVVNLSALRSPLEL